MTLLFVLSLVPTSIVVFFTAFTFFSHKRRNKKTPKMACNGMDCTVN